MPERGVRGKNASGPGWGLWRWAGEEGAGCCLLEVVFSVRTLFSSALPPG